MRKSQNYLAILCGAFLPTSCGGGSGTNSGGVTTEKTINFIRGQAQSVSVGNATIYLPGTAFLQNATVKLRLAPAPSLNQPNFQPLQSSLSIESTAKQEATLSVSYPDNSQGKPAIVGLLEANRASGSLPIKRQNNSLVVSVEPSYYNSFQSREGSSITQFVIGALSAYAPPDQTTGLVSMGLKKSGWILVYVHGLLQTAGSNDAVLEQLRQLGGYGQVLSFQYDWRLSFKAAGEKLAAVLATLPFKQVDIVAYSKGGLVTRWALEKEKATRTVRGVMFLGTPHLGCALASTLLPAYR